MCTEHDSVTLTVEQGTSARVTVSGREVEVFAGRPVRVPLIADDSPTFEGAPSTSDIEGALRPDGSVITATMPLITERYDDTEYEG